MQYSLLVNLELARSWSAASQRLSSILEMLWKALAVINSFLVSIYAHRAAQTGKAMPMLSKQQ